ncbi:glycerate kinase, partial [Escherichia coli]|uniref:glycerate kinase n=1 Tax=Escherichia coli TaxID=562 RepID=UPI00135387E8
QSLESGATNIIIVICGSATNYGLPVMVQALGANFFDAHGNELGFAGRRLNTLLFIYFSLLLPPFIDCFLRFSC